MSIIAWLEKVSAIRASSPCLAWCWMPTGISQQLCTTLTSVWADVCKGQCLPALRKARAPRYSFVAFDAGLLPQLPDLVPWSPLEELIVAPMRVHRRCQRLSHGRTMVCRAAGRPRDAMHSHLSGHVVAVPNVPLKEWHDLVFPLMPKQLAEAVDVVILTQADHQQ